MWAGIDVGGRRKGFDLAAINRDRRLVLLERCSTVDECIAHLADLSPSVVAIDAPSAWARDGESSRACERDFARSAMCGIRFTPDAATAAARTDRYLEWIEHGLELWSAVTPRGRTTIEAFPTASWTAWCGDRAGRPRAQWTRGGVAALAAAGIDGLERVRSQDQRDCVAAALTARQWALVPSTVSTYGDLRVPHRGSLDAATTRTLNDAEPRVAL